MNPDSGRHNSNTDRAHWRALRATGRRPGRSTIVLGVLLVAMQFGAMGLARAVDIPQTADLYLQTSGPSAGLNIGDVYTTPVAQGGDGTDHVYQLTVPSGWPVGTPVTVAIYDPESFEDGTATAPSAIDEVRGGATDQTTFQLRSPSGAALQTTTFTTTATNGRWYELLTFDPAVTGYGNYALHVTTGDGNTGPTTVNDDDNSWRLRFVSDPDCVAGNTGVCTSAQLSNGNETDNVDGLAGTGDELAAGIERGSFQHAGSSSVCNTYYFYVGPTTPRDGPTGGILAHNFDMDNSGSVTYTDPTGGTHIGTISANARWNNSANSIRVGDELPAIEGWWSAEVCLSANNQYVFEGPSGSWTYLDARPQNPQLDLAKDDAGVTEVARGDTITYTIQFSNPSDLSASPGQAVDVSITDAIPTGTTYMAGSCAIAAPLTGSCSLDGTTGVLTFALTEPVNPGATGSVSFAVTVDGDAAATISNTAQATFGDSAGNVYSSTSNTDTNALVAEPVLTLVKSADLDPATVGDTITYTYSVSHDLVAGDGSDVSNVTVLDSRGLPLSGPTGDDGDGVLESGETWTYTATESVTLATPDPLTNDATVDGTDLDGDPIPQATASASVDIDWEPVLAVTKVGSPDPAVVGDTVTYTYTVTHDPASDGSAVLGVSVVDSRGLALTGPVGDDGDGLLESAETWTYTATETIGLSTPDPLTNTVTVDGLDRDGDPMPQASGSESVDVDWQPVLTITKTGPATALAGSSVSYDVTVSHAGASDASPISNVVVTDPFGTVTYTGGDTNSNGVLEFGESWTYTVVGTLPASPDPYTNTASVQGTDLDAEVVGPASDDHLLDVIQPATISDLTFTDVDGDGIYTSGTDSPLAGVVVNLYDATGTTLLASQTTAADGLYSFGGLAPDAYLVEFVGPAGHVLTAANQGADDTIDSDATPVGAPTGSVSVTVADGETDDTVDAGFYVPMSIGDFVWVDLDGDGVQDIGEPGLAGVDVTLNGTDGLGNAVNLSTTTEGGGAYSFDDLAPGAYTVTVDGTGWTFTVQDAAAATEATDSDVDATGAVSVTTTSGTDNTDVDAGVLPVTIGDYVWVDADGDGLQDGTENGIGGVTVNLRDAVTDAIVATTVTAADGSYELVAAPGDYVIEFVAPAGYAFTASNEGADDGADSDASPLDGRTGTITIVDSTDSTVIYDAGLYELATISDFVWIDADADGTQDAAEAGLDGVTVTLTGTDGAGNLVSLSTTTAGGGLYSFDVPPGSYTITFDLATAAGSYVLTAADQGGDDALDSDAGVEGDTSGSAPAVTVTSGDVNDTVDAGAYELVSISGTVLEDDLAEGSQDGFDTPLAGITVNLLDEFGAVVDTTTTDINGDYTFTAVPGTYSIEVVAPSGGTFSPQDADADTVDSDVDATGETAPFTLSSGESTDQDALIWFPAEISDFVWVDLDQDGLQDAGEPGLEGVTVNLLDDLGNVVATTTTAADGTYAFSVAPGTYSVEFVLAAGSTFTTADVGGDDTIDSDVVAVAANVGETMPFDVTSSETENTVDAGVTPATLGDFVWVDADGDGLQGVGELGLEGVTVTVTDGATTHTTVTASDGSWSVPVAPGTWTVTFDLSTNTAGLPYAFTPQNVGADDTVDSDADATTGAVTVVIGSSVDDLSIDAGAYVAGAVSDFVWDDLDGDGIQDPGEPGLVGVVVHLVSDPGTDGIYGTADDVIVAADTTDGAGAYTLPASPGDYTVVFFAPADHVFSAADRGGDDTADSDAVETANPTVAITAVSLLSGVTDTTVDAGLFDPVVLGDGVWVDLDQDGIQDPGEPGWAGMAVTLTGTDGAGNLVSIATTTDALGAYEFTDVAPGTYTVTFDPTNVTFTTPEAGADDAIDSDAAADGTASVTTTSGTDDRTIDAGIAPALIGDLVFDDLDADGIADAGEPGLAGVTVTLTGTDASGNAVSLTTVTDASGGYTFAVAPGTYTVAVTDPAGTVLTTANDPTNLTVVSGETVDTVDFGFYAPATLGDRVWNDLDADGIQDAGEPGVAGVTVDLWQDTTGDGFFDTFIGSTITDAAGAYSFTVDPGVYQAVVTAPAGSSFTLQDQGADNTVDSDFAGGGLSNPVVVTSGEIANDLDAGLVFDASIGDVVWDDLNGDGIQDAGEPGLGGITVNLTGTDYTGATVSLTTTTDATGTYGFTVLPGTYTVGFVAPAGTVFTAPDQGTDDTVDSDADPATGLAPVTVGSGEVQETVDAGLYVPATIGNVVWDDLDGNGIQDAGEPGIAGATVELLDSSGVVVATTTTDGAGAYSFSAQPGTYSVRVTAVAYAPTATDQGGDDTLDSDIGPTGETAQFSVVAAEANDTVDAGLYVPATIGDFVWDDLNGNGVQDAGEPGLVGVTVNLTGTDGAGNGVSVTTTTDAGGAYGFEVAPGTYVVEVVAPAGDVFSAADQGGDDTVDSDVDAAGVAPAVTLASGETNDTIDAALSTPATLSGTIWDDADGDGIQDAGEPGVAGVTVNLLDEFGAVVATTTTDATGTYTFAGLTPGAYQVAVVVPVGDVLSPVDQGGDDTLDSDFDPAPATSPLVMLTSGETNDTIDGGLITTITIGDQIFNDLNADGIEDADEPGLGGVTVTLTGTDTLGNPVSATTVTGAGGFYQVTGLLPGDYTIDVDDATLPPGATLTTANDPTSLIGLRSGDSIADVDFGYDVPAAVAISKTALTPTILSGETATFEITVSNVGSTDLGALTVSDPLAPACETTIAGLVVGASTTHTCSLVGVTADFVNEAIVTGTDVFGTPVSDSSTAPIDVIAPAIAISKTPNTQQVVSGGVATFTITIQNNGDVDLTNVTVTDAVAPACDNVIGNLASGAIVSYTCTLSGETADYTNSATVTADAPAGPQLTAADTADVDIINPSFTVTKTPDTQYVRTGETASFTVEVTNTGDVDLTVTVTDAAAPGCDFGPAVVAAGATQTITCAVVGVSADFSNTVVVDAADPNGDPLVQQSDTADVIVIDPAITIDKTPSTQTLLQGQDAVFTIRVTNTGDSTMSNVVVSDPQAPTCDRIFASIAAGLFEEYTCTVSGVSSSFTNVATVTADDLSGQAVSATSPAADVVVEVPVVDIQKTPNLQQVQVGGTATFTITVTNGGAVDLHDVVVSDPLAPDCDRTFAVIAVGANETYSCTLTNVTADFTNTASVTAQDAAGNAAAPDSDVADVDAITPSIAITKTADTPTVFLNGTAQFMIEVTNTGDVDLTDVTVTDAQAPDCDTVIAALAVGASQSHSCSVGPVTADFTNTAIVTATPPAGPDVTDSASAGVTVLIPGIDIQKTPDYQIVGTGGTVDFTITVTNTGATDLSNIVVTDGIVPACDAGPLSLPVGESTSYTCTSDPVTADFTNQVDVSAEDPAGNVVSASDTADVDLVNPTLTVTKSPALQTLLSGETASFSILVENTGDIDLQNVVVNDPLAPGCDSVIGTLAAGTSQTITCDVVDVTADFTNTVDVTADDPLGGPALTASDTADVDVVFPGVDLQKTPDSQQVVTGTIATFTITITNTGDQDLVDLVVTDAVAPDCDATIAGPLAPGASTSYTCTMTVTSDVTNVAAVTGQDINGNPVSFSDDAFVDAINPSLSISKTPDSQTVVLNGQADFAVAVTNTGDVPLSNVDVTDPLAPDCDRVDLTLAIGETRSWTCSLASVAGDFTNTVTGTADDPNGDPVAPSAADTADVTVLVPAVEITKSPNLQQVQVGDDASFTILVTNSGETDLFDVVVSDPLVPACDATFPTIPVAGSETYTCTVTVTADFTNTVTADAIDPLGNPVPQASDVADVDAVVPAISVAKTPDIQTVPLGDPVTFTIEVTNTGDADLTDVVVSDALVPACDATIPSLLIGETQSYTCTSAFGVTADFTNTAVVAATPPVGVDVSASDTADVVVLLPDVTVDKSPATQVIGVGDDATFTIRVTNSGQVDLVDIVVTDSVTPSCSTTFAGPLLPGDFAEHTCTASGVTAPFTNSVDVSAEDGNGNPVTASDTAEVAIDPPALSVTKDPSTQDVPVGGTATFTITVINTSRSDLVDVTVSDPQAPACDAVIPSLPGIDQAPANSVTISCSEPGASVDYTNTVTVTATDLAGGDVGPVSDTAGVNVLAPAISVTKDPATQLVGFGQDATFTITVTNTGEIDLLNVVVTDAAEPTCDRVVATLAVGEIQSWMCTTSGVVADFTNTVDVIADDGAGNVATATASADVVVEPVGDVSGFVFVDADGDGVFDPAGDTPLAFVDVVLTDPVGNPIIVTTDATGTWQLANTPVGDYVVDVDESDPDFPAAHYETTATDGQTVTVADGASVAAADIGYAPSATISGTAFEDLVGDGLSTGDPALVGTTVHLYEDTTGDGVGDTLVASTSVAADGSYTFAGLPAGDYVVAFVPPTSYEFTVADLGADDTIDSDADPVTGRTGLISLLPADVVIDVDAGAYLPIELGGTVFNDLAGDGAADPTDPPMAGIEVIITGAGPDGAFGTVDDTTVVVTTSADGTYQVGLPPGDYSVEVVEPAGTTVTTGNDPTALTLTSGDAPASVDFGIEAPAAVSGTVMLDADGDAIDSGVEPPLDGITVTATHAGPDGVLGTADDIVRTTTTDANGNYVFVGLAPGDHVVAIDLATVPPGATPSFDPDPTADGTTTVTLAAGETMTDVSFGVAGTGSLTQIVWHDVDGNGLPGPGEPVLVGVTATATWTGQDGMLGTSDDVEFSRVTDATGTALIPFLPAGDYEIVIDTSDLPEGLVASADPDGTADSTTLASLAPVEAADVGLFGYTGTGTVGDLVFFDYDQDGNADADEPGAGGVGVIATWAGPDGVIGTADDIVFTTTTAADGSYLFANLPAGDTRVELDPATLPAGSGGSVQVVVTLAGGETNLDVDFGLGANLPPLAQDDAAGTLEDTPVTIPVLSNDSDPEGHGLEVGSVTQPANGTVTINPDGTVTYVPDAEFSGTDTFTYTVCEDLDIPAGGPVAPQGLCDIATVIVTVEAVNDAPVLRSPTTITVVVGQPIPPLEFDDPEGSPVTVVLASGVLPPGVTLNVDGTFSGTPTTPGVYTVTIEACDPDGVCSIVVLSFVVRSGATNDDPALPFTGNDSQTQAAGALALILAGAALVMVARRADRPTPSPARHGAARLPFDGPTAPRR